ncbi:MULTISPECIES: PAS domain-containing protein [Streptomyces]|uniref:PAS domain-containing protein n=1 Tax=Streptomyces canarius TaxID=285453 RepID=A0ABQ3DBT5_9ACTN|nr:PAS domain-containing protein [Streptomyces canarius]GHA71961.1 hypothetical protein GCM10010345_88760 [Streptomyces canarius]
MDRFPHAANVDFHSPLDLSKAATAVLDAEGRVSGWGSSAQRLLGHSPEEVLGQRLSTPCKLCKGHKPRGTVLDLCCRDGRILRAAVTFSPLAHRGAAATVVVAADLDTLRGWEAQLAMLQGLATESVVGLTIFDTDMRVVWGNVSTDLELAGIAPVHRPAGRGSLPGGRVLSRHHPPDEDQIRSTS